MKTEYTKRPQSRGAISVSSQSLFDSNFAGRNVPDPEKNVHEPVLILRVPSEKKPHSPARHQAANPWPVVPLAPPPSNAGHSRIRSPFNGEGDELAGVEVKWPSCQDQISEVRNLADQDMQLRQERWAEASKTN